MNMGIGITEVKKLKPYRFNFKTDDDSKVVQGFFAHEAQEIVPYAVSGTKDEVVTQAQVDAGSQPEDKAVGDPIYQNVDSFIDETDLLDDFEDILPDEEYGIFVITLLNGIQSDIVINTLLDSLMKGIQSKQTVLLS